MKKNKDGLIIIISICITFFLVIGILVWENHYEKNKNYQRAIALFEKNNQYLTHQDLIVLAGLSISDQIKEINVDCSQDGIKGDSLVKGYKEVKEVEKEDLNCKDRYTYNFYEQPSLKSGSYYYLNRIEQFKIFEDRGCTFENIDLKGSNTTMVKCPVNNCKKKIIINKEPIDSSIFEFIKLQEIGGINCKFKLVMRGD